MKHNDTYIKLLNCKQWRLVRNAQLARKPLCEMCKSRGKVVAATCVHHIEEVESGHTYNECRRLAYEESNLMSLCMRCHVEIHKDRGSHTKEAHQERAHQRLAQWLSRWGTLHPRG